MTGLGNFKNTFLILIANVDYTVDHMNLVNHSDLILIFNTMKR